MALPEASGVGLLRGADPNAPLLRFFGVDVLIGHVFNQADLTLANLTELHVNAFEGLLHVNVSEGHVPNSVVTPLGANCQAQTTRLHVLDENITRGSFHSEAVVLIPNFAVVDPDVLSGHIPAVLTCHAAYTCQMLPIPPTLYFSHQTRK